MAQGDQVRLPHGRGVGVVIDCHDSIALVFVGRKGWYNSGEPVVHEYVECELIFTGKHLARVAQEVAAELHMKDRRNLKAGAG
jgi:hypothetical protein